MRRLSALLLLTLLPLAAVTAKRKQPAKKAAPARRAAKAKPAAQPSAAAKRTRAAAQDNVTADLRALPPTPLEQPEALLAFFERLHRLETKESTEPVRILHYGDSHTAADEWTGRLRLIFQERFGDAGAGFSLAGRPFKTYRRQGQRSAMSRRWDPVGLLARDGDGIYGLGGAAIETRRRDQSVTLEADARDLELWYWQQPGGGRFRLLDNGRQVETVSTDGDPQPGYLRLTDPATPSFEVETLDNAPVRLFGWVAENGPGVTYETLGINGAQLSLFERWRFPFDAHLARRDPALVILAYGTNEASNPTWDFATYKQALGAAIDRIRAAAPAASILIIGPPDRLHRVRRLGWQTFPRMSEIIDAQRAAALEHRCAFWDWRQRMGGPEAMKTWVLAGFAQKDHVHFTAPGYSLVADTIARDILTEYTRFASVRQRVFDPSHGQTPNPH